MSERELRKILRDVMDDIDEGRLRLRNRVRKGALLPAVMAAGLGLSMTACETDSVGNVQDARADVYTMTDAAYGIPDVAVDAIAPAYMGPIVDGGVDAEVIDAEVIDDAAVDSGPNTLYMGPPPIDTDDPDDPDDSE